MGPVITAEVLIRHGVDDDAILRYLTRQWGLNDPEPRLALHAAHILWAREHSSGIQSSSAGTG
jgi:hypothetical protein